MQRQTCCASFVSDGVIVKLDRVNFDSLFIDTHVSAYEVRGRLFTSHECGKKQFDGLRRGVGATVGRERVCVNDKR